MKYYNFSTLHDITSKEELILYVEFDGNVINITHECNVLLVKRPPNNSFTNNLFEFGYANGGFGISSRLKTIKKISSNAPKIVERFEVKNLNISSLEGCPEKITDNLYCNNCTNLTDLKGIGYVGGNIYLSGCEKLSDISELPIGFKQCIFINQTNVNFIPRHLHNVKCIYIDHNMKNKIENLDEYLYKIKIY